jgi:hypothetical protein
MAELRNQSTSEIFTADALNPEAVINCICRFGCVQIKGAIPPDQVEDFCLRTDFVFALRDQLFLNGALPEEDVEGWYMREVFPHYFLDCDGEEEYQLFRMVAATPLFGIFKHYFQGGFYFDSQNSYVRRQRLEEKLSATREFHQDNALIANHDTLLTCWIPFMDCGIDTPSLEVLAFPVHNLLCPNPNAQGKNTFFIYKQPNTHQVGGVLGEAEVLSEFGEEFLWHPSFSLGDVMIFSGTTVHRTYITPQMTKNRYGIDVRVRGNRYL